MAATSTVNPHKFHPCRENPIGSHWAWAVLLAKFTNMHMYAHVRSTWHTLSKLKASLLRSWSLFGGLFLRFPFVKSFTDSSGRTGTIQETPEIVAINNVLACISYWFGFREVPIELVLSEHWSSMAMAQTSGSKQPTKYQESVINFNNFNLHRALLNPSNSSIIPLSPSHENIQYSKRSPKNSIYIYISIRIYESILCLVCWCLRVFFSIIWGCPFPGSLPQSLRQLGAALALQQLLSCQTCRGHMTDIIYRDLIDIMYIYVHSVYKMCELYYVKQHVWGESESKFRILTSEYYTIIDVNMFNLRKPTTFSPVLATPRLHHECLSVQRRVPTSPRR